MEALRIAAWQIAPDAMKALKTVDNYVLACGLEKSLVELVRLRSSQINGCAFCLDKHSKDARRAGETEQRLYLLDAWRESLLFTPRERAALEWTEAVTRIAETRAPDDAYAALVSHFSEREIVDLTVLVSLINAWNRLAISFRYQPTKDATN